MPFGWRCGIRRISYFLLALKLVQVLWCHSKSEAVVEVNSLEKQVETLALLKLLAMRNEEIEQGKFRDAEAVFADLDEADLP